jgi:hypothetical protein
MTHRSPAEYLRRPEMTLSDKAVCKCIHGCDALLPEYESTICQMCEAMWLIGDPDHGDGTDE